MNFSKKDIVHYRLERAREALSEAALLRDGGKWLATVNRLYYACFYAISAYFVQQNLKAFTHSGLKSAFNKELVQGGKVGIPEGRLFNQLFSFRQDADYKDFVQFSEEDIALLLPEVENLVAVLEKLVLEGME
ncbi:MAG: HEPN domain-containing protein [Saprospiraceae bacterium]